MDYSDDKDQWDWRRKDYSLQIDMPQEMWTEVPENENISYMFDATTPVKACGDLAYHVSNTDGILKEPEECRETCSQSKRRRMLQFNRQDMDHSFSSEEMSSSYFKSNEKLDSLEDIFPETSPWVSDASVGNAFASHYEDFEQPDEGWLAECLNDAEIHFSPDNLNFSEACDGQIDVPGPCDIPPESEANVTWQHVSRAPNIIFKGRKSFIQMPTKLASSVAYPFDFVKPSGAHGGVTLKEINQKICTPPPSKSKQNKEDPSAAYPRSAFSGKPVVGKTKIRTEGGKGSITIMRTKG